MHNDSQISLRGRFDLERAIAEDEAIDVSPVVERYHRQKQEELPSILPVFLPTVADIMDAQKEESEKYSRRGLDLERATPEERRRHRKKTICCWSMFAVIMFVFASGLVWFVFLSYHRPAPSADHTAGAASISSSRVSSVSVPRLRVVLLHTHTADTALS